MYCNNLKHKQGKNSAMIHSKHIYVVTLLSLLLGACATQFRPINLNTSYMTSIHEGDVVQGEKIIASGKPVLKHNKGDLLKDRYWWALSGIQIVPQKEGVAFDLTNIGPKYTPFGADLPLLDFKQQPVVLKITARAESSDGSLPLISLQFDDAEGMQANAKRPEARIGNTTEFMDYYFDCSDMWMQTWPDKKEVNATIINKWLFFVNPGGSGYTGKIYIKAIQALPIDSLRPNPEFKIPVGIEGGVVANFNAKNISEWWNSAAYSLAWEPDSSLKVVCSKAGANYEAFGMKLPQTINAKMAYRVIIKARFEGEGYPELRMDVIDCNGSLSNGNPQSNWLEPTKKGEFVEYLYIYKDDVFQAYPTRRELDKERITDILLFVNPGKDGWSGTIYIDEIKFVYTGEVGRQSDR